MDMGVAARLNAFGDPKAIAALGKGGNDPAKARAVAAQFGTLLFQRVMQTGDGEALPMAEGTGGGIVNSMLANAVAQTAAADDRLGLADLLFRSIEGKQQAARAASPAAGQAAHPSSAGPPAPGQGFSLSAYWQGNGLRPIGNGGRAGAIPHAPPGPSLGPQLATAPQSAAGLDGVERTPLAATAKGAAAPAEIDAFARQLAPLLQQAGRQLGVSPKILLAQAALETAWGRSMVGNNLFGIKAGSSWPGAQVAAQTHEVENGQWVPQRAAFRAYPSLDAAVQDYVALIGGSSRYKAALGLGDNARAYGRALIDGGYATDGDYPAKLEAVAASPSVAAAFGAPGPPVRLTFFSP